MVHHKEQRMNTMLKHYNRSLRYFPEEAARITVHARPAWLKQVWCKLTRRPVYVY